MATPEPTGRNGSLTDRTRVNLSIKLFVVLLLGIVGATWGAATFLLRGPAIADCLTVHAADTTYLTQRSAAETYVTRAEYEQRHQELSAKVDALQKDSSELLRQSSEMVGILKEHTRAGGGRSGGGG